MLGSLRKLTFLDLGGCRWACGRPSIWEVEEVIASAECFVVASHIGINCAVSNELVHLTLLLLLCRFPVVLLHCSVLPVQQPDSVWSFCTLCNYDGRRVRPVAETEKVSLVKCLSPRASSPTSRSSIDFFGGHNSCEFAQLFCLHVFVVALRSSGLIVQL